MIVLLILFGMMWFGATSVLRNIANMTKHIEFDLGSPINTTKWGSGNVNGVTMRNCLRIVSHNEGFVLETNIFFGGGKLWLPKEKMMLGEITKKTFFKPRKVEIISANNQVSLHGELVDAVTI